MSTEPYLSGSLSRAEIRRMVQDTPPSGKRRPIGLLALVATLGSLLFGYDTGVIAGALPYMYLPNDAGGLHLSSIEEGLVGALLTIGAAFGAIIGGRITDRYGRRFSILVLAVVFVVGTLGCTLSPSLWVLYPFRFILGWAVGGASATVPLYLSESAPKKVRGPLVAVDQFMIVFGQLIAYSMNAILSKAHGGPEVELAQNLVANGTSYSAGDMVSWDLVKDISDVAVVSGNGSAWRYMLVLATIPAVLLWLFMRMMPESSRWYAAKQRYQDAIGALKRIRPENNDEVTEEVAEMIEVNEAEAKREQWNFRQIWRTRWTRKVLLIGCLIGIFDQLTGINTAMYYVPKILHAAGFSSADAISLNVVTGAASCLGAALGFLVVAKLLRRHVGMYLSGGVTICLAALALAFGIWIQPHMRNGEIVGKVAIFAPWLVLILISVFLLVKQSGTIGWILMSEIFPAKIRGVAQGIAVGVLWITNSIVTFVFPLMMDSLGGAWTYAIFAAINVVAFVFFWKIVPETKPYSLEQVEEQLEKKFS